MKVNRFALMFLAILVMHALSAASLAKPNSGRDIWNIPYPDTFNKRVLKNKMTFVSVKGNTFVTATGSKIIFRGVNISDPDKLKSSNRWNKSYFQEAKKWGANILRVPVHPLAWRERGAEKYLELLDQAVVWANQLGLYLIIDWHSIGNLSQGIYQHASYDTDLIETRNFWRTIAHRYQGISTIAFYEIFNEPTTSSGRFGYMSWSTWRGINEDIIDLIYAYDKSVIPLVAGFNWAYDLSMAMEDPVAREGIAYVSHPYPQKAPGEPQESHWDAAWGFMSETAPVIATEIGWMRDGQPGSHIPTINNDGSYGPRIVSYMKQRGISWVVWAFDPDWTPNMFTNWKYRPTAQGKFFKKIMLEENTPIN